MVITQCKACLIQAELSLDATARWECTACRKVNLYESPSIRYINVSDAVSAGEKVG